MKAIIVIVIMLIWIRMLTAPPGVNIPVLLKIRPMNNNEAIWQAVIQVESGGNPMAYCIDINGKPSVGIAQIQQSRISHYNRLTGASYNLDDCFDPEVSKEVFMYFAERIGNEERLIRAWNGSGPMTKKYYNKVKARL